MLPTLTVWGDAVYTSKRYKRGNGIKLGDLVDFKHPMVLGEGAIKRVMGMPGDFVRADGGIGDGKRMIQVGSSQVIIDALVDEDVRCRKVIVGYWGIIYWNRGIQDITGHCL